MTNSDIISQVVTDPLVYERQTKYKNGQAVPPTTAQLESLATAALQHEINSLLNVPAVRRAVLEADYSLTLSGGTEVDQGYRYEMPSFVGSILNITIGDDDKPLEKKKSRVEFDRWWYDNGGDSMSVSDTAQVWTPWGRSPDGDLYIVISPGYGSSTSANVHYVRKISQPVNINILPDDIHYLVVTGMVNRLTGQMMRALYLEELQNVENRLEPMIGGASPMSHSKDVREFCAEMSIDAAGPMTSDNPLYISRSR